MYSTIYSMERRELIEGLLIGRKTKYKLTEKGKAVICVLSHSARVGNFIDLVKTEFCLKN
jgi:hypothetical protein